MSASSTANADGRGTDPRVATRKDEEQAAISQNLRLRDLHVPVEGFHHASNVSSRLLDIGSSRLDEMEDLLGMSPRPGREMRSDLLQSDRNEGAALVQIEGQSAPRESLTARFVASIWEDERSVSGTCPIVYMQRCRAAIDGLAGHGR